MVTIRFLRIILLLIMLLIPFIYIFIFYDTDKMPKRKLKKMRSLLEIEDRGEFFQGMREYLLKPYSNPLTSAMRPEIPQDEQGIYDFYHYNYMENYRQRKGQGKIVVPMLVAVLIVGLIPLLLMGDLSWYILLLFVVLLGTGNAFAVMMYKWAKAEKELIGWLEERMSSYLEEENRYGQ